MTRNLRLLLPSAKDIVVARIHDCTSLPLAPQDLSPLLQSERDHLVAGVALEIDFGANGFRDEDIPFDRREFERSLVGALHEQLRACGEDTQRKVWHQRIAAD